MILGALLIVLCAGQFARGDKCQADVVFVIDVSSSIKASEFTTQINFVNRIIDNFDISPVEMQIACVTFSRNSEIQFGFDSRMTKNDIKYKINAINHVKGQATYIYKGISDMRSLFKISGRAGVPKIAIILTDGDRTDRSDTPREAEMARKENITIIVIGVGEAIDRKQLEEIASEPTENYVFMKNNFDDLNTSFSKLIAEETCKTTPAPKPICHEERPLAA